MLQPKLRFKEFNSSNYEDVRLIDFADRVRRKNTNNETDIPLTISSLDGLIDQRTYFGKPIASKDMSNYYLLKKGEFAYNKSYSNGFPVGSIKRLDNYNFGALSTLYICFSLKESSKYNSDYIKYYFESTYWHKKVKEICAEGARNHGLLNVSVDAFFEIEHTLATDINEQKKIASFLSIYDERIKNEIDKINELQTRRKSIINQLFNQKIRFKGYEDNWETYSLGDFLEEYSEKNKEQKYEPVAVGKLGIRKRTEVFTRELSEDYSKNKLIYAKTLIIAMGTKQIDIAIVPKEEKEIFSVSPAYTTYHINNIDEKFLKYMLESFNALLSKKYMIVSVRQGKSVDKENLLLHTFDIPNESEQKKIVSFLELIDKQIEVENSILENYRDVKKSLLQQLFC